MTCAPGSVLTPLLHIMIGVHVCVVTLTTFTVHLLTIVQEGGTLHMVCNPQQTSESRLRWDKEAKPGLWNDCYYMENQSYTSALKQIDKSYNSDPNKEHFTMRYNLCLHQITIF